MFVHSRTIAPTSGFRRTSSAPASRMSRSAAATSSASSSPRMARVNSRPPSVPITGVPPGTPALARCSAVIVAALIVRMPARRPGGRSRLTIGTCIMLEIATGTPAAAAIWSWNSDRNPQLEVMPSAPRRTSSRAASRKGSSRPAARSRTTRCGEAPATTVERTGKGQVVALPMSPGMRGKRASSIRMPTRAP